ncbi:hypothetical protein QP162_11875 [Sphingomonas aurantiaca]|uniref:hypothetical protein n=1 Tax=Sphingomonas aurantiaca TaxID=185949 RepID=UPI002FDF343F
MVFDSAATVRSRLAASSRIACAVMPNRCASARLVRIASSQTIPTSAGTTHSAAMNWTSAMGSTVASAPRAIHSMAASQTTTIATAILA